MSWFVAASGKRGRSPKFSDTAIQFCLTIKNLFRLALRQTTGFFAQSQLVLDCGDQYPTSARCAAANAVWMCRWRAALAELACTYWLTPQASSSLAKASGSAKKHGAERRRQWRKLQIVIDAQTL